jgi:hypothetical protein
MNMKYNGHNTVFRERVKKIGRVITANKLLN